jgi:glycosyltransferase involved in cell wall biosynthesis
VGSPVVSVLLPLRDEEAYLGEALTSLSAQTFGDFEVIAVDDGSSDATPEIVREHARRDRRFRLIEQPAHGIVPALERARAEAGGRFVARMDGDDVALPERLEVQVQALDGEPGLAACGGRISLVGRRVTDGARQYERWINSLVTPELAARDVFVECPIAHPALLVRRDVLFEIGGYRHCAWPEDYDLVLRLWASGARFRNVESTVLFWRDHPARLSRTHAAYSLEAFRRCKVHYLRQTLMREIRGAVVWGAGPVGKAFARELERQDTRVLAFVEVDPRKIGKTMHGAPVVGTDGVPRFAGAVWLGAVAGEQARSEIRSLVAAQGRREGVDFVAVA